MSDYTKLTDFAAKDALASGNANKIVKGTEIDDEFEAIETAVATKANSASPTLTGTTTIADASVTGTATIATASVTTGTVTTLTSTTANITTVDLGDWTITESSGTLQFAYQGTVRFELTSTGDLSVEGDVTAYDTL